MQLFEKSHRPISLIGAGALAVVLSSAAANAQAVVSSADGRSTGKLASPVAAMLTISEAAVASAKSRLPMLKDLSQVPGFSGRASQGYGTDKHPFTTKGAYSTAGNGAPVWLDPWRMTGKLFMTFGSATYVCTASVIDKGLLVTAAHCVHDYGMGSAGFADAVSFQPARHGNQTNYGTWTAARWWVPTVYYDGTDRCVVSGVVCDNDIAIVVLNKGTGTHAGKNIATVVGRYKFYHKKAGYTTFLGKSAAQITQLGYPVAFDGGRKMIRTDSLGYKEHPNNLILGSDQTGGSSGGPWLMNFGANPSSSSSPPKFGANNRVAAVTSWGFVSSQIKVMGASRFNNNPAYPAPGKSNLKSLIDDACAVTPGKCY